MKTVFVLFDSLNRLALGCYGGAGIRTPNFDRFAKRAVAFDNHYVGSLPCMLARRDLHTGRLSFFHRRWGPLEPFDNSMPEILSQNGVYTHLISDDLHYFEDGGATLKWTPSAGQSGCRFKVDAFPPLTKGAPVLRYDALADAQRGPMLDGTGFADIGTALFDLANDPRQEAPLRDAEVELRLDRGIRTVLEAHDAPAEFYDRYGL